MADRPQIIEALLDTDITVTERVLLAVLARYQGRNNTAWPKQETLAADLDVTERTIRRLVESLVAKGKIEVIRPDRQGRGTPNQYHVRTGKKADIDVPLFDQEGGHPCPKKADIDVRSKRIRSRNTSERASEKTFVAPTVEQVRDYASTLGNPIFPAERFIAYYADLDWRDKNNKPVKCWKGRVRTWHDRENERRVARGEPPLDGYSQYGTRKATAADIAMLQAEGIL